MNKVYTLPSLFWESVMSQRVKPTQKDYTLAFKQAVVEQVERVEMTYKQAQSRYGIQGRTTVLKWLRRYGHQDWSPGATQRFRCPGYLLLNNGSKSLKT